MEENYFVVYVLNCTKRGKEIMQLLDVYSDTIKHVKGFSTKRKMTEWVEENKTAFNFYFMLKPVS